MGADPSIMIDELGPSLSMATLRLFAVACCRRISDLLDSECKLALDVADRYAHGRATTDDLREAALSMLRKDGDEVLNNAAEAVHAALYDPLIEEYYFRSERWPDGSTLTPFAKSALKSSFSFAKYASIYSAYARAAKTASVDPIIDRMEIVMREYEDQCELLRAVIGRQG